VRGRPATYVRGRGWRWRERRCRFNYTQQQADAATKAALEATGGGTANRVETDNENVATYEVEVTKPDSATVDVHQRRPTGAYGNAQATKHRQQYDRGPPRHPGSVLCFTRFMALPTPDAFVGALPP
jgi:hypothetical protein